MKKLLLILPFTIIGLFFISFKNEKKVLKTEEIKWLSFKEAQELNKKTPKKFLIDVYTNWCGWCKQMDAKTYKNEVIVKYVNQKYYAIRFNAETKDTINFNGKNYYNTGVTHQLANYLLSYKLSYPTVVYLNEELGLLQAVPGYLDAKGFEPVIKYFGEGANETVPWPDYQQSFVGDVK